jgi:anaerobic magnesium-protoporphyrin IX monomethyl ester cyclase
MTGCDVLLINPPFLTLTSMIGVGHQVPLGLLMVGGALLDAGVRVQLLDAECTRMSVAEVVAGVVQRRPRIVMAGHAGSTAAHETCVEMFGAIKAARPGTICVFGGPYPTYHAREILAEHECVDVIVRGEGEATAVELTRALLAYDAIDEVQSIAFRRDGRARRQGEALASPPPPATREAAGHVPEVVVTSERVPLDMNDYRIGWELLDENGSWDRYQCFGLGRAVIVQFSRGCPHHCTYCGQRGFWMQWRHRDPVALADEIEWLVRARGVRFVTLADENPTTLLEPWHLFLREVARRGLPVKFFSTIRASDIVRDREHLDLWAAAGIQYILMGIDGTDEATLKAIKKGSTTRVDFQACRLLREHGIYSMIARIVGLSDERWSSFWQAAKQVEHYDGDYLNIMYVTPHAWTEFAAESRERVVADENLAHWNYRRPVLGQRTMKPWQTFLAVKLLEFYFHNRPRRLWRLLTQSAFSRQQLLWCTQHIGAVWVAEIFDFLRNPPRTRGRTLEEFQTAAVGECRHEERVQLRVRPSARVQHV